MPDIEARMEFLARLPLYESEKPYLLLPLKASGLDPDETRLDNLEFESHGNILVKDMRHMADLSIESNGFEYHSHETNVRCFDAPKDIDSYQSETQDLLRQRFSASYVHTYDVRLRSNERFSRREFDLHDKLMIEGPAKGVHVGMLALLDPSIALIEQMPHSHRDRR